MLIISKFRDYYDNVRAFGVDKTNVFNREQKDCFSKYLNWFKDFVKVRKPYDWRNIYPKYHFYLIGFCGRTFCCVYREDERFFNPHTYSYETKIPAQYFYNFLDYQNSLPEEHRDKSACKQNCWGEKYSISVKSFFEKFHDKENLEPFLILNSPIFCLNAADKQNQEDLTINPELRKFGFQKVFDHFQTFQKISQFLTNELAKEKRIPETPDKYKILAHDMDKWSFRNPDPPKRKQKN